MNNSNQSKVRITTTPKFMKQIIERVKKNYDTTTKGKETNQNDNTFSYPILDGYDYTPGYDYIPGEYEDEDVEEDKLLAEDFINFPNKNIASRYSQPPIDSFEGLSIEEKIDCLNSDEQLEKMLKSKSKTEKEDIIINLDSNIELDYELKKKILLNPYFFAMLVEKNHSCNIRKIIKSLDLTNPKEQELKKDLFKTNLKTICESLFFLDAKNILDDLNVENSTDAEIKRMMFLEKPYKLFIAKIQDPCYTYWHLDWNNPIDREIKKSFFFDDENLQIIIDNIYPGFFITILEKDEFDNPLDLEIKNRLFLNKEVLKAVLNRFSKSMTNYYMGFILSNRQTNKPIKEKIFLDDELSQILINKIDESDIDRVTSQLDEKDDIDNKFRRKLLLTPTRFISLLKRYRVNECLKELQTLNTQNKEEAALKKTIYIIIISSKPSLISRKNALESVINSLNPNDATDMDIKETLLTEYRDFILKHNGFRIYYNLDEKNQKDRKIKVDFFINEDNQELILNNILLDDFIEILKKQCEEDSLDYKIKQTILLNDKVLSKILNMISSSQFIQLLTLLNNGEKFNSILKEKVFSDNNFFQIIINKMDREIFLELIKTLDYSNSSKDKLILTNLLEIKNLKIMESKFSTLDILADNFQEKKFIDIALSIIEDQEKFNIAIPTCNIYNLMMALHNQEDYSSKIEALKPYAFNPKFNQNIDYEMAENIVFKLMDPNNPKDIDIITEILFDPNTDKRIFDVFAVYLILLVFHAKNDPLNLSKKIKQSLYTDLNYTERIMSCANAQNLSHTLDKFNIQNDKDYELLYTFISSDNFINSLKKSNYIALNRIKLKWKKIELNELNKLEEDKRGLDNAIKAAFEFANVSEYSIEPITGTIDTPQGSKKVFIYDRSIIMVNPKGEQFIINVSGGSPAITPPYIIPINRYGWLNHSPSIANCLLSWGFPESEITSISGDSDKLSFYAASKGIITLQIEGENAFLFIPENIDTFQSKTFDDTLKTISKQEEKTNTRLNFLKIVLPDKQKITKSNPDIPFYSEEIYHALKSIGIIEKEITEESASPLKRN